MLTRSSQIGEFYVMAPPQVKPEGRTGKFTCDMLIYDEESDRHVRVTWARRAQGLLHRRGCRRRATDRHVARRHRQTWPSWATQGRLWTTLLKGGRQQGPTRPPAATASTCASCVARPFIEHLMHNVIMTVAGRDTGATLFGPADMQLSANTQVKTIEGHYTGHFKAVVTKPQNVLVMRDVACAGYVAGCNTRWFATHSRAAGHVLAGRARTSRRASRSPTTTPTATPRCSPSRATRASSDSGQLDTVMSRDHAPAPVGGQQRGRTTPPSRAARRCSAVQAALQPRQVHYGEDMKAAENQDFISQGSTNNATCFLGPSRRYDPFTKSFMSLVPGQGHFGPDAIPGDARWRRGESVSLKTARDTMVALELAQHAQMVYSKA